jgi:hypothetical protein
LLARSAKRAIPAAKGIALIASSASGIFQSVLLAFVIEEVYELRSLL